MKKAFTILELLVVVAIIAILAVAAIPNFMGRIQEAEEARFVAEVDSVQKAVGHFFIEEGHYPTEQGQQPTYGYPMNIKFSSLVSGGYMTKLPSFSYWYTDFQGTVIHTQDKLETIISGSDSEYVQTETGKKIAIAGDYSLTAEHPESNHSVGGGPESTPTPEPTATPIPTPTPTPTPAPGFKQVAAASNYSLVLKNDSSLWKTTPTGSWEKVLEGVESIGYNAQHAITTDKKLYVMGYNGYGQLALGDNNNRTEFTHTSDDVKNAYIGSSTSFIVKSDGSAWAAGSNSNYAFGFSGVNTQAWTKTVESGAQQFISFNMLSNYISDSGALKVAGYNSYGRAGLGHDSNLPSWTTTLTGTEVKQVTGNSDATMLLTKSGQLMAAGKNDNGVMANGVSQSNYLMQWYAVPNPNSTDSADKIQMTSLYTMAKTQSGKLYASGQNYSGPFGIGNTTGSTTWTLVASDIVDFAAAESSSIVLKADGTIWAAGLNVDGRLGVGDTNGRTTWTQISLQP